MRDSIGGYFGLELPIDTRRIFLTSDSRAVYLNTARNSLEYILLLKRFKKIYIPYFTCDVILEPLHKLGITHQFYDIDNSLEPLFDYSQIKDDEAFLYTNYFGIKTSFINTVLIRLIHNNIIDNAQALFSKPIDGIFQFYSPRKFLGLADGGIVIGPEKLHTNLSQDTSYDRMAHLLKRLDLSAEAGYSDFQDSDRSLIGLPIRLMSNLTRKMLYSCDFERISQQRVENFLVLHEHLHSENLLDIRFDDLTGPMVYPFRTRNLELRKKLIAMRIYCAKYWPNVKEWCTPKENSYYLTDEIIAIPVDQRYTIEDMKYILSCIKS